MICSCRKPNIPTKANKFQRGPSIWLKQKALKTGYFAGRPEPALGGGGRAFKSPRPDQ
jgi:hypothetical protein